MDNIFTVYVLYSSTFNKHYTGFTSNLEKRMISHNQLGHDWTAKYRPWNIIFTKHFTLKTEAMAYEKWLKTGVGRQFILSLKLT
jgi:putative endonuclease